MWIGDYYWSYSNWNLRQKLGHKFQDSIILLNLQGGIYCKLWWASRKKGVDQQPIWLGMSATIWAVWNILYQNFHFVFLLLWVLIDDTYHKATCTLEVSVHTVCKQFRKKRLLRRNVLCKKGKIIHLLCELKFLSKMTLKWLLGRRLSETCSLILIYNIHT